MKYNVSTVREAGLQARWTKTRTGRPIIEASDGGLWYVIDDRLWQRAKDVGIKQAFEEHTALGEFFSVRA